jgi:Na+/H+ antiporter NhaA
MSLFVAMVAFEDRSLVDAAKRGIIAGSLLAGIVGAVSLKMGRSLRDVN